jgi:hypothetical protein
VIIESLEAGMASYEDFLATDGDRLQRLLVAHYGVDVGTEVNSDTLAWAWEHWDELAPVANRVGYLYRVAQSLDPGSLKMSADLEDRLHRYGPVLDQAAQERAGGTPAATGTRHLPGRRAVAVGTAAAVAAAALVVIGFVAGDDSGYRVRVAAEPEGPAPALDRGADGSFPHLLIGGWRVSRADESTFPRSSDADAGSFSQVYRHPERGYDGAQVAVQTMAAGADWGRPDGAREVDAGSGHAVIYRSNDLMATVVWTPEDGRTVVVRGTRVDDDELVKVVRGLQPRDTGGWEATRLPEGLALVAEGPEVAPERFHNSDVEFTRGDHRLELTMAEGDRLAYEDLVDDRVDSAAELRQAAVLGRPAAVTRYEKSQRHAAMWFADGVVYELDGDAGDRQAFVEALGDLRVVDADTWEAALPDSSVPPRERAAEIDRMLADIPQPPGFDPAPLRRGDVASDRYQLGARVTGAVACAWIDRWAEARRAGGQVTVNQAVDAMATSRNWRVLGDMNDEGDYPEVLWQYADAMAGDGQIEGGKPMSVEESAPDALGCPR